MPRLSVMQQVQRAAKRDGCTYYVEPNAEKGPPYVARRVRTDATLYVVKPDGIVTRTCDERAESPR